MINATKPAATRITRTSASVMGRQVMSSNEGRYRVPCIPGWHVAPRLPQEKAPLGSLQAGLTRIRVSSVKAASWGPRRPFRYPVQPVRQSGTLQSPARHRRRLLPVSPKPRKPRPELKKVKSRAPEWRSPRQRLQRKRPSSVPVSRADDYRRKAEECRLQASKSIRADDKATWLQMAEDWQRLAEGVEASSGPTRSQKKDKPG